MQLLFKLIGANSNLSQAKMQSGINQETEEDHPQMHGNLNINYTVNVNSFNVHNITMEDCYNNVPITRSSFSLPTSVPT